MSAADAGVPPDQIQSRMEALGKLRDKAEAIGQQPGARLPGAKRLGAYAAADRDGVPVSAELLARIKTLLN